MKSVGFTECPSKEAELDNSSSASDSLLDDDRELLRSLSKKRHACAPTLVWIVLCVLVSTSMGFLGLFVGLTSSTDKDATCSTYVSKWCK